MPTLFHHFRPFRRSPGAILLLLGLGLGPGPGPGFGTKLAAHPGPDHEIEELTELLQIHGESSDLLIQRAIEYQIVGKLKEAEQDLSRALQIDPGSLLAQRELSGVYFDLGKTNQALETVTQALAGPGEASELSTLRMARARILLARKEYEKALEDVNEAIRQAPGNVEWYLVRSQLQARLKRKKERVQGLEEGIRETGSGVLATEWVDSLIEDGRYGPALERIEAELKDSRWQSSWLLRRARVRSLTGHGAEAKADVELAIEELNNRTRGNSPDPALIADRGLAYDLLGDAKQAERDYSEAIKRGVSDYWIRERLQAVRNVGRK